MFILGLEVSLGPLHGSQQKVLSPWHSYQQSFMPLEDLLSTDQVSPPAWLLQLDTEWQM